MLKLTLVKVVEYRNDIQFYASLGEDQQIPDGINGIFDENTELVLYEVFTFDIEESSLDPNEVQVNVVGMKDFSVSLSENLGGWFIVT